MAIIFLVYAFTLLSPIKTERGKKILNLSNMVLVGFLFIVQMIVIVFGLIYRFFYGYNFSVIDLLILTLSIMILIPSLILISIKTRRKIGKLLDKSII